jgi:hypothetical protein
MRATHNELLQHKPAGRFHVSIVSSTRFSVFLCVVVLLSQSA